MKQEFIFLGPPASGKGTQTELLAKELNLPHVDTGSMLRAAIKNGSEEGQIAKSYMDKGALVPAEIVVQIIKNRLKEADCNKGFILDGYPRSLEQAKFLDEILEEINQNEETKILVIRIDVAKEFLLDRILNRRFCSKCGKIYNLKNSAPKVENTCDVCAGELAIRNDDTEEVATKRFETYTNETAPLVEYYEQKGWLKNINGEQEISAVFEDIKKAIQ